MSKKATIIVWGVIFLNLVGMWLTRGSDYDYLMALLNIGGIALVVLATWIGKTAMIGITATITCEGERACSAVE